MDIEEVEICRIFSRNLKRLMDERKVNQKELAALTGASKSQVSFWCLGRNVPRTNYLAKLTRIFDCKLSDLLTDKTKAPPPVDGRAVPEGYEQLTEMERNLVDAMISKMLEQRQRQ